MKTESPIRDRVVVQLLSCIQLFVTHEGQHARLPVLQYLSEFAQTHVHRVRDGNPLILCLPLLLLPSVFPQHQGTV